MSENFTASPPEEEESSGMSTKTKAILAVLGVLLFIGVTTDSEESTTPDNSIADAVSVADDQPDRLEQEEAQSSSTGDYDSVQEYQNEIIDTSEKMASAFDTWSQAIESFAYGDLTSSEFQELASTFLEVIDSHYQFYDQRTPPAEYKELNRLLLKALDEYRNSVQYASDCARDLDESACQRSIDWADRGNSTMDRATASINS